MYWHGVLDRLDLFAKGSWFIYLTGLVLFLLSIILTKNISRKEWILLFGMVGFCGWMSNIILFFLLDVMDSGDPTIGGLSDIFMFVVGPAANAILFLNYYTKSNKFTWVIIFSVISLLIEFTLVKLGFIKLKGWKTFYSIPFYIFLFRFVLPWILKLIRK